MKVSAVIGGILIAFVAWALCKVGGDADNDGQL